MPVSGELAGAAELAAGLKGLTCYAVETCRLRAVSPTLQLVAYSNEERARLAIHGVHTCKSPLCPLCASKWQRTRSDEISQAIDRWDGEVFFITETMKHNRKMSLSLQHRLLTAAWGSMWSGSAGRAAADELGGKPESIRAHDRTWSSERGWHPHLHSLLFVRNVDVDTAALARMFDSRWPAMLQQALKRFKNQCLRILTGSDSIDWEWDDQLQRETGRWEASGEGGCGRPDCRVCQIPFQGPRFEQPFVGPLQEWIVSRPIWRESKLGALPLRQSEQDGECRHFRERATRLFGVRMFPRTRKEICGVDAEDRNVYREVPVSIHDSARKVYAMLEPFTASSIRPNRAHGTFVERMRDRDRLPRYLVKMGLELASSLTKVGRVDERGVRHYGHWEVARIAATHGHPLRKQARAAWQQLFFSTRGTQTITFSDREALGLPDDPLAEGDEGEDPRADETTRVVGCIEAAAYRERVAEREHGVLIELAAAYANGELGKLDYVDPPGPLGRVLRTVAPQTGPPSTADPCAVTADGYLAERPEPWEPSGALPFDARVTESVDNGTPIGAAYRAATAVPSSDGVVLPDQLRRRLRERIGE